MIGGGLAPAISYPTNEPLLPNSVCFHGDLHAGRGANATSHMSTARADLLRLGTNLLVQVGDMTENGLGSEDTTAIAHLTGLPATNIRTLIGNHDLESGRSGDTATAAWGFNARNWTFDLGPCLLISTSYNAHNNVATKDPQYTLAQAELDWLAAQIDAATKDCWIVCHAPLAGGLAAASSSGGFAADPDTAIRTLLDSRPRATCWFSGHTRNICNVNVSAIAYVNPGDDLTDPVNSIIATYRSGGVDLRIRDHARRYYLQWTEGGYVRTLQAS
jgi:hypothetical protein